MPRRDELEHDTREDATDAVMVGTTKPYIDDPDESTIRQRMRNCRRDGDGPWLDPNNPAIWDGENDEDD